MLTTPRVAFQGRVYAFHKYSGLLLCYEGCQDVDCQHTDDYSYVENPFFLNRRIVEMSVPKATTFVKIYARFLILLSKHCFPLIFVIPHLIRPVYQDAGKANAVFYSLFPEEQQRKYCLPRALFTASMSKRFKDNGTMFIGAFLPLNRLHSWVIEDGKHADVYDNQWTQYTPVMEWQWKKK